MGGQITIIGVAELGGALGSGVIPVKSSCRDQLENVHPQWQIHQYINLLSECRMVDHQNKV